MVVIVLVIEAGRGGGKEEKEVNQVTELPCS